MFKKTLLLMLTGALLGVAIAAWAVPPAIAWYAEPGGLPNGAQVQSLVPIPEIIRYATHRLILWQAIAAAIGAVLGVVVSIMTRRRPTTDEHHHHES